MRQISVSQYLDSIGHYPNILKQSADWRLDHILDIDVPYETRQQWICEIKEIMEKITE